MSLDLRSGLRNWLGLLRVWHVVDIAVDIVRASGLRLDSTLRGMRLSVGRHGYVSGRCIKLITKMLNKPGMKGKLAEDLELKYAILTAAHTLNHFLSVDMSIHDCDIMSRLQA